MFICDLFCSFKEQNSIFFSMFRPHRDLIQQAEFLKTCCLLQVFQHVTYQWASGVFFYGDNGRVGDWGGGGIRGLKNTTGISCKREGKT